MTLIATSEISLCAIALMENKMPPFTLDSIPNLVMPHTVVRLYVETRVPKIPMPFDLASADETNEAKRLFIDCTRRALPFEEVHGGRRQGHNRYDACKDSMAEGEVDKHPCMLTPHDPKRLRVQMTTKAADANETAPAHCND